MQVRATGYPQTSMPWSAYLLLHSRVRPQRPLLDVIAIWSNFTVVYHDPVLRAMR